MCQVYANIPTFTIKFNQISRFLVNSFTFDIHRNGPANYWNLDLLNHFYHVCCHEERLNVSSQWLITVVGWWPAIKKKQQKPPPKTDQHLLFLLKGYTTFNGISAGFSLPKYLELRNKNGTLTISLELRISDIYPSKNDAIVFLGINNSKPFKIRKKPHVWKRSFFFLLVLLISIQRILQHLRFGRTRILVGGKPIQQSLLRWTGICLTCNFKETLFQTFFFLGGGLWTHCKIRKSPEKIVVLFHYSSQATFTWNIWGFEETST